MELVVTRDDLVECTAIRVFLEHDEVLKQVEEPLALEHATHHHFQFERGLRGIAVAVDRAPDLEPLLVRGERTDARLQPVAQDKSGVVVEKRRNLGLVRLQLGEGAPDRGVLVHSVLQLEQGERQPVEEQNNVWASVVLSLDDRELVHRQPVVAVHTGEVDQSHMVACD